MSKAKQPMGAANNTYQTVEPHRDAQYHNE